MESGPSSSGDNVRTAHDQNIANNEKIQSATQPPLEAFYTHNFRPDRHGTVGYDNLDAQKFRLDDDDDDGFLQNRKNRPDYHQNISRRASTRNEERHYGMSDPTSYFSNPGVAIGGLQKSYFSEEKFKGTHADDFDGKCELFRWK